MFATLLSQSESFIVRFQFVSSPKKRGSGYQRTEFDVQGFCDFFCRSEGRVPLATLNTGYVGSVEG
jgi:hypothetical protein